MELHPALRTREKNTLLDCVSEGKLRTYANECKKIAGIFTHYLKIDHELLNVLFLL